MSLQISPEVYLDKVKGAWYGKCAGITLGSGLRGRTTPSAIRYYVPVPGQHSASVALDFMVTWLEASERVGPDVREQHLKEAWRNHLHYWHDEFGYVWCNWERGIEPPASGTHSNWFHDSTGGALRADFWALLLPGAPQVAAAFAYRDSQMDHSMEGVWGAMLLAAMGSAAFFIADPLTLFVIGLAMVPRTCRVARAVKAALKMAHDGEDWLAARERVLKEVGNANFSDIAQNIGFVTIGLLYGFQDFGAAISTGVNCGYDTEFVGGTVGAIAGLLRGAQRLSDAWTRPLGEMFIPGPGLHDLSIPNTLAEVPERLAALGARFVQAHVPHLTLTPESLTSPLVSPSQTVSENPTPHLDIPAPNAGSTNEPSSEGQAEKADAPAPSSPDAGEPSALSSQENVASTPQEPTEGTQTSVSSVASSPPEPNVLQAIAWADNRLVKPLLVRSPYLLERRAKPFLVSLDAGESLAISHLQPKKLLVAVTNEGSAPFVGQIQLEAPAGWQVMVPPGFGARQVIAPQGILRFDCTLLVPEGKGRIGIRNPITVRLLPTDGGKPLAATFVLPGASCWWVVGTFENVDTEGFDRVYPPEDRPQLQEVYTGRLGQLVRWERRSFGEAVLDLEPLFHGGPGVCYGQTTVFSPSARPARLVAATNSGVKVWFNGLRVLARFDKRPFRPTPLGSPWAVNVRLNEGANHVMVKWVRAKEPFAFALLFADEQGRLMADVGNTSW